MYSVTYSNICLKYDKMEDLNLSETEMRYFGDLFLCCDEDSNGKIPILKATELFRSSNISNEVLKQIMDISVAPNDCTALKHMNRKQFYSALKLIAVHQNNLALKPDLLTTQLDLPLPRFTWALNSEANLDLIQLSNSPKEQHVPKRERSFGNNLNYEPIQASNLSDSDIPQSISGIDNTEAISTDSEIESETMSQQSGHHPRRIKNGGDWSTGSDSATPTNSVAEQHPVWEHSATGRGVWPANTAEEHTQLLGTEEECSDRHSSEEEGECVGQVWAMSDAQARHYAAQFARLGPNSRHLLPGQVARLFFEKSRLPVADLRKIWQLSDITKDGALSLEEFSIAMHLIVLRRNDIPVPDVLPSCLVPKVDSRFSQQAVTTDLVDLGSDMFSSGTSADFNFVTKSDSSSKKSDEPPAMSPPKIDQQNNKEWTKFADSPTSSISSPGPKPVNFDFHKSAVEGNPKIFHPVALRVTPDHDVDLRSSTSPRRDDISHAFDVTSPKRVSSQPPSEPPNADIKPISRPQPKKPVKSSGVLPPPPAREPSIHADEGPQSLQYKKDPPPPPPRPVRNHTRSSSLDLNRFKGGTAPPPPPRVSPPGSRKPLINQHSEGDSSFPPVDAFAPRDYDPDRKDDEGPKRHGAFEVYRKARGEGVGVEMGVEVEVRSLLEQNSVLRRVCRALAAELADVQRDRETLRHKLDSTSTAV